MGLLDGWHLCPRDGHELDTRERGHLACPQCGSEYYANSAPAVVASCDRSAFDEFVRPLLTEDE